MRVPDPFYDEFHRLQPDIRVVLLPPAGPSDHEPEAVSAETASARATRARRTAQEQLVRLWPKAAVGSPEPTTMRQGWSRGKDPGEIRARASGRWDGAAVASPVDVDEIVENLAAEGWAVREERSDDAGRRVVGERGASRIEVLLWGESGPWDVEVSVGTMVGDHIPAIRRPGTVTTLWNEPADEVQL